MGNIDRKLVLAGLKELKGMKDFCIEEPQGLEGEGIWFRDVLEFCINSLETDEAYQLEYESTTKNDLEVDAISRAKAIEEADKLTLETGYDNEKVIEMLNDLPSVTPQEPKSEWEHDHEILKAYSDGVNEVLNKIYTDIQKLRGCSCSCSDGIIDDVEDILDKYKAESEDI